MNGFGSVTFVLLGVLIPTLFVTLILALTRRADGPESLRRFHASLNGVRTELREALSASRKEGNAPHR